MNILRLIAKEFKLNVRSYKANIMMVLFPIVLILILGAAFSGQFDSTITLGDMKVLYTEDVGESRHYLTDAFKEFRESLTREYGLVFEKTDDADAGMESVKGYKYAGYIQVSDEMGEIRFYNNEKHGGYKSVILESALSSFIKTYGAMEAIAANKPEALGLPQMQSRGEYVSLKSLNQKQQPGSLDYYAVTMVTMILLYASLTGFWSVYGDITQMTAGRVLCAPVKRYEFLTGKVIGCIMITVVQGIVVVLFSKWVLKANWGNDLISVVLLLASYSVMSVSLGVGLAHLFKKKDAANGLLNTIIPVIVFLGGGYVPLSEMGPAFNGISSISPVKWANTALFKLIYDQDYSQLATSVLINLAAAAVFILISALFSGRGATKYA
jgi:ABC-2 type transport system permease protein